MDIKIDVNLNLNNIENIIDKISNMIDLNKAININNKNQEIKVEDKQENNETKVTKLDEKEDISTDTLRYLLVELSKQGKAEDAKNVLKKFNCTKIPQLKQSDYKKVYDELKKVLN